jgi:hypothetical protein
MLMLGMKGEFVSVTSLGVAFTLANQSHLPNHVFDGNTSYAYLRDIIQSCTDC